MVISNAENQNAWRIKTGENPTRISLRTRATRWVEVEFGMNFCVPMHSNFRSTLGHQYGHCLAIGSMGTQCSENCGKTLMWEQNKNPEDRGPRSGLGWDICLWAEFGARVFDHNWNSVVGARMLTVLKRTMEDAPELWGSKGLGALTAIFGTSSSLALHQKWRTPYQLDKILQG